MSTLHNSGRLTRRTIAILTVTVVTATLILLYFIPRESTFGYVYEQGKPWRYPQLIASYDFVINKSEAEVSRERDSVLAAFRPYYRVDSTVVDSQMTRLRADFEGGHLAGVMPTLLPRIVDTFRRIYAHGIIDSHEQQTLAAGGQGMVRLVNDMQTTGCNVQDFYTERTAYAHLAEALGAFMPAAILQKLNLNHYLSVNVHADEEKNASERTSELARVSDNCGMVQSGQLIIDRGQIVGADHVKILDSLKVESERRQSPTADSWLFFSGHLVYILVVMGLLVIYLKLFRRDYLASPHTFLLLFTLVTLFPIVTYIMVDYRFYSVYLVPYAILPMFVRIFMDSRTSAMALFASSLLSAVVLHSPFEFLLHQTIVGFTVICMLRQLTERSQLLRTGLAAVAVGLVVSTAYDLTQGMGTEAFDRSRALQIAASGLLLLFAYPLMYLVERIFGFTSSVTLVELTDINNPLLRRMSKVAQGTFNHSMQVANLAAEVADKIGASPQLVRTGALYHDIGKMLNPAFFTENQSGVNPHDSLSEENSAQIIISHVTDGLRLAEKHHLPPVIRGFISTHHGDGLVKYFYIQYANKHPEEEVDKALFSYPGPKPRTREEAVLMMCDSVEAASRSLKEYTEESIQALVDRIVDAQLEAGNFRECPITFRDIADAKRTLVDSLKTIYHTRIAYPEMKRPEKPAKNATESPLRSLFGGQHRKR